MITLLKKILILVPIVQKFGAKRGQTCTVHTI